MTEAEQLEAIKKWWKRYSNAVTVVLSIVLLLLATYKYWNWHQDKITQQASSAYEHMMSSFSNQDNKGVKAYANQLITDYGRTIYADVARLTLAKIAILHKRYTDAQRDLEYVAGYSKVVAVQQIAKIRLARIYAADKEYEKALEQLVKVDNPTYMPVVNELKGDIFAAMGQYQKAVSSYKNAINDVQSRGIGNLFLEMKTNELVAMSQTTDIVTDKNQHAG